MLIYVYFCVYHSYCSARIGLHSLRQTLDMYRKSHPNFVIDLIRQVTSVDKVQLLNNFTITDSCAVNSLKSYYTIMFNQIRKVYLKVRYMH
jgi:hypothetical protein